MKSTWFYVQFSLLFASQVAHAYELATHATITYYAYGRSVLNLNPGDPQDPQIVQKVLGIDVQSNPGNPFGDIYYDVSGAEVREQSTNDYENNIIITGLKNIAPPRSLPGWLMRGAIREDDWGNVFGFNVGDDPHDDPYGPFFRSMNHFYDPVGNRPLTVNTAQTAAFTFFTQENTDFHAAPAWMLGTTNASAFTQPNTLETGRRNHHSLVDAREAMFRALTLKTKNPDDTYTDLGPSDSLKTKSDVRNAYWATTFRALGDVVHLVQDMGRPQHTRNILFLINRISSWGTT